LGAALQADGEYEVRVYGLKHQKEKRSMDHFAGLDVSVKAWIANTPIPPVIDMVRDGGSSSSSSGA